MVRPVVIHGARIQVMVNGIIIGVCTSFQWSVDTNHREIQTVDIQFPAEYATTRTRINWSMGMVRVLGDGGAEGMGLVAPQDVLPRGRYFSLALVERGSGATIFRSDFNVTDTQSWSVEAKALMRGQAQGKGFMATNEFSVK